MTMGMDRSVAKLVLLRAGWARGDFMGALRIASRFGGRSPKTLLFKRGWDAASNAAFFRQLKRDPEAIRDEPLDALARKFKLP